MINISNNSLPPSFLAFKNKRILKPTSSIYFFLPQQHIQNVHVYAWQLFSFFSFNPLTLTKDGVGSIPSIQSFLMKIEHYREYYFTYSHYYQIIQKEHDIFVALMDGEEIEEYDLFGYDLHCFSENFQVPKFQNSLYKAFGMKIKHEGLKCHRADFVFLYTLWKIENT